jgi:hypothetical protein
MREKPRRKQLVLQTLGNSPMVRIVVFDDDARRFVEGEVREFGELRKERGVDNVYVLYIDEAYDQISVEAYIRTWPERQVART